MIRRFEEIKAWLAARELVREVYRATSDGSFAKDYSLKDQVQRAAVSAMSNIAEGFDRGTDKEFIQFLVVARGSIAEVQSQLYVALDLGYLRETEFEVFYERAAEVGRLINGFISYLRSKK